MVIAETEGVRTLKKVKQHLLSEREAFYRQMADGARKQANFYVADVYMKLSLKAGKALQALSLFKLLLFNYLTIKSLFSSPNHRRLMLATKAQRPSTFLSSTRWSNSTA
jgi:hypothetical protein